MTINSHTIIKHVLQARTAELLPSSAAKASASLVFERLKAAAWRKTFSLSSAMPPHDRTQTGFNDKYVACLYAGDYNEETSEQHAYACAAVFTITVPADALTGDPCYISSVSFSTYIDQWLTNGAVVKAIISSSATPPTWDEVVSARYGAILSSPDSIGNNIIYFPTETAADNYIHLVVVLNNYETANGEMIEGAVMLIDDSISVAYSRDVVADTIATPVALPTRTIAFPSLQEVGGALNFGGDFGMAWYTSTVASPIARTTELAREMSIKQALAQFPYAVKTVATEFPASPSGAGLQYVEAGATDNVRVDGAAMALFYHAQQARSISRFTIFAGMPGLAETGWHDGLHIRWAVYHIAAAWETDALSPTTLQDPLFWRGTATSITFQTEAADRTVAVTPIASFIMPDGGYANGDTIPVLLTTLATRGTFLMAWHPEDVTDHDIPAAMDTFYGIDFTGQIPHAMFIE